MSYLPEGGTAAGEFAAPELLVPAALLGGPAFGLWAGDMPSLGPLFPVVLGFIELPVVVELAAGPPEAELPPAVDPAPEPALCANAAPDTATAVNNAIAAIFILFPPLQCGDEKKRWASLNVPRFL